MTLAAEVPAILEELGTLDRVVGISAYTTYPEAALNIPKVSGFEHGSVDRILSVKPDLIIATSPVQQQLVAQLGQRGAAVLHFHPHRLTDLFDHIRILASLVDARKRGDTLVARLKSDILSVESVAKTLPRRPRAYFEEWMDPLMSGVGWVSDLIEIAGGTDVFRERILEGHSAKDRVVTPEEWVDAQPDIMFASWCGKPFVQEQVLARPGADTVPALQHDRLYAMDGTVLECGMRLVDRLREMATYIGEAARD